VKYVARPIPAVFCVLCGRNFNICLKAIDSNGLRVAGGMPFISFVKHHRSKKHKKKYQLYVQALQPSQHPDHGQYNVSLQPPLPRITRSANPLRSTTSTASSSSMQPNVPNTNNQENNKSTSTTSQVSKVKRSNVLSQDQYMSRLQILIAVHGEGSFVCPTHATQVQDYKVVCTRCHQPIKISNPNFQGNARRHRYKCQNAQINRKKQVFDTDQSPESILPTKTINKQEPEVELILHKAKEVHVKSEPEVELNLKF
jgi:hypothetical protein